MVQESSLSRRSFFVFAAGLGIGVAATGIYFFNRTAAVPYPALVVPSGVPSLMRARLLRLHSRYSAIRTAQGVAGVRLQVAADLKGFAGHDEWIDVITDWIDLGGWSDTADFLIDAAEIGGDTVRRNSAAMLAAKPTPLLMANGYGPRIIRLHLAETDPAARDDWRDLRNQLGI